GWEGAFRNVATWGAGAPRGVIVALIEGAIAHGVPIYNDGSHLGCALIYSHAARLLLELVVRSAADKQRSAALSKVDQILKANILPVDSLTVENANDVAWRLRHAFDAILRTEGLVA